MKNPFEYTAEEELDMAHKLAKVRFGSECKHEQIKNEKCKKCFRKIYILRRV